MELVIRKGTNSGWGFVEKYSEYGADNRLTVKAIVGISPEGKMVSPYVFRGKDFIPLKQIDEEMGIHKYIQAKKPFYSLLSDGFIASIDTCFIYETGEIIPEKSCFTVYTAENWVVTSATEGRLRVKSVLKVPDAVKELIEKIQFDIAKSKGNREVFLRNRIL